MSWFDAIQQLPAMLHAGHWPMCWPSTSSRRPSRTCATWHFLSAGNLQAWQDKIEAFGDMVAHRRQAYAQRLPLVLAQAMPLAWRAAAAARCPGH